MVAMKRPPGRHRGGLSWAATTAALFTNRTPPLCPISHQLSIADITGCDRVLLLLGSPNLLINLGGVRLVPHLQGNAICLGVPPPRRGALRGLPNPTLSLLKHSLINPDLEGLPWDTQRLRTFLSAERKGVILCRVNDPVGCFGPCLVELFVRNDYTWFRLELF